MSDTGGDSSDKLARRAEAIPGDDPPSGPLTTSAVVAPPPPSGTAMPATTLNIALMQKPDAIAQLPPDIQRQIFGGIERENERQFELAKKQMEMADKARSESMQERSAARQSSIEERSKIRTIFLTGGIATLVAICGVFVFLVGAGHETAAMKFLEDVLKVGSGVLGGAGGATIYQRSKKQ